MRTLDIFRHEPDVRTFSSGATIFREGDAGNCMFAVVEDEVEILKGGRAIERLGAGGLFGELALIDGNPRGASAVAASDCKLAALSEKRFTTLVQQNPYFALQMMRILTERIRRNTAS